jgi:nucleoside-diphosphate-sugar epimerase
VTGVALVTGASGFVGSHLVEELLDRGWRVRALLRATSSRQWLPLERVETVPGDIMDAGALRVAVADVTAVFHLAAITSAVRSGEYVRVNVGGTRAVCDAIAARNPDAALIHCSSLAAGGPVTGGRPVTEADDPHPITPYGASKLAAERVVGAAGLRSVIVRPPAVYGPRDTDVLAAFRLATRGFALHVGPAGQRLSMVHVRDLARGMADAAAHGLGRGVYYVSGAAHSWEEIVGALAHAAGRRVRSIPVPIGAASLAAHVGRLAARVTGRKPLLTPDRVRDLAQRDWTCDDGRARRELSYAPRIALADGMRDTLAWYRREGWV